MLKDWLTRALADAIEKGEKTLSRMSLEQHALSVDRCDQMVTEATAGEAALTEDANAAYRLRVRLGLEQAPAHEARQQAKELGRDRAHTSGRVGQRKPQRDQVKSSGSP